MSPRRPPRPVRMLDRLADLAEDVAGHVARRFFPDAPVLRSVARDCLLGWSAGPSLPPPTGARYASDRTSAPKR